MVNLLILAYFTYKNGKLAVLKGEPVLKWRLITIGAWILFEIIGVSLSSAVRGGFKMNDLEIPGIVGFIFALVSYHVIKTYLTQKPNIQQ